ncbi:MAG: hypothetical protein HYU76_06415 [Betaproteobacteria bacterium]|nr:hypothetical protein [Betaproteobacteria bacterium]
MLPYRRMPTAAPLPLRVPRRPVVVTFEALVDGIVLRERPGNPEAGEAADERR